MQKKRNIIDNKSVPKGKLLRIINNKKTDRKCLIHKKKTQKILYKPTKNSLFKLKKEKIKKSLYKPARKNLFKSKIAELRKILHESKINENRKTEEVKKFFMIQEIIFDNYKAVRISNAFSSNYIEYKSNRNKDKTLLIKDYHDEIKPYLINLTNDYKTKREWKIHLTMAINFFLFKEL